MGMEIEVKVLGINIIEFKEKIEALGGHFSKRIDQQLYTYDFPTVFGRYVELLFGEYNTPSLYELCKEKMTDLLFEIDNLTSIPDCEVLRDYNVKNFSELIYLPNWKDILSSVSMIEFIKQLQINPRKWVRLRKSNEKVTIAVKHILESQNSNIQQLLETEVEVESFNLADQLLRQLGFCHKSFQEKRRYIFYLKAREIDIDEWPGIPPYMEIEGSSEQDLSDFLELLGYKFSDCISCTADAVYQIYGKNMFEKRNLVFE